MNSQANDFGVIKPKKNQATATTSITEKEEKAFIEDAAEIKRERAESNVYFETLPMKIAHSRIFYRKHTVSVLFEKFLGYRNLWHVDFYFPYAKNGPLYLDEPRLPWNVEECRVKAPIMRAAGLRYCYLEKNAKYDEAILQLEGKL